MAEEVVYKLYSRKETISAMESCTGGAFANAITNIQGSYNVIKFSAVTYSSEYMARLGVDRDVIEKHSVYSIETAREMAFKITFFSECTYGIGITGRLNTVKKGEEKPKKNKIFISIYNSKKNEYTDLIIKCPNKRREKCKEHIVKKTLEEVLNIMMSTPVQGKLLF